MTERKASLTNDGAGEPPKLSPKSATNASLLLDGAANGSCAGLLGANGSAHAVDFAGAVDFP